MNNRLSLTYPLFSKNNREELRNQLVKDSRVTSLTKWNEISELYQDNIAWKELPEYDRLQLLSQKPKFTIFRVFSKWIIELDRQEHENKRKNRRRQERKNRDNFRELLKEQIEKGTLNYKTKWRYFVQTIKDDPRFLDIVKIL